MNVNKVLTKDYEEKCGKDLWKNEPKTNPIKANTKPIQTQTKPIAERVKLMQSVYLQRIMKKNADRSYEKTKPKQSQSKPISKSRSTKKGEISNRVKVKYPSEKLACRP